MGISIIIPTLNEAGNIGRLVRHLKAHTDPQTAEIIVVDGGSTDDTLAIAAAAGAKAIQSPDAGRAVQMNYGVRHSRYEILYFVHADTLPPETFATDLREAIGQGYPLGCFRFRFDSDRLLLRLNSWFTRFDVLWCRGGDQSLYITREIFQELGGFCTRHVIMEEYDLMIRARRQYAFRIIPKNILVSARKYEHNSYLRVQIANLIAFNMYRFGYAPKRIYHTYRRMLDYR